MFRCSWRSLVPVLLVALAMWGCGGDTPEKLLASAKENLAKKDAKAAVIQAKNALEKRPDFAEARFVLGKVLLESGDARAAELELRKALELRYAADQVQPLLAQALLATGQYDKLIAQVEGAAVLSADSRAELKSTQAAAYAAQGKMKEAQAAIAAALAGKPDNVSARLMDARLKAAVGDLAGALTVIEGVVANAPTNAFALKFKGDLLAAQNQAEPAITAYRKALEVQPDFVDAHTALAGALVRQGKTDAARAQLDALRKVAPNDPRSLYVQAALLFVTGDYKKARDTALQLLKVTRDNAGVLTLAGSIEYSLGSYVQAEEYLARAVSQAPESILARRWLAQTYLGIGQPGKAAAALEPVLGKINEDSAMLALAGEVFMQAGNVKRGEEFFVKAVKLDPKNPGKRTSVALARFLRGDAVSAFSDLSQISSEDSGTVADSALLGAYARRGEFDKALKVIDVIEKKRPGDPVTHNLRGRVLASKKDFAGARRSFERALELSPAYFPAVASLAEFDIADNKLADAQQRFEKLLVAAPRNSAALLALADIKIRAKAPSAEVLALIEKAISGNPVEPMPRVALVTYRMALKDMKAAISAAQEAVTAIPGNFELLDLLGQAQVGGGEINQALATYGKLAAAQPGQVQPHLRMAQIHAANKDLDATARSLRKALDIKPDLVLAQRGLITLDLGAGKTQDALAVARTVQKQRPAEPVGYLLEGDIGVSRKAWDDAINAYRAGLKQAPMSTELAIKLHRTFNTAERAAEADKFGAAWIKDNPKDATFRFNFADMAAARGDHATAVSHYRILLGVMPENPALLNNLAVSAGKLKEPDAIALAEKANKLAPGQPAFMDTLGVLLAEKGDTARALELLGKASQAAPQAASIRLDYARVLVKAGKKPEARKELEELAKLGDKFRAQAEVAQLLKDL